MRSRADGCRGTRRSGSCVEPVRRKPDAAGRHALTDEPVAQRVRRRQEAIDPLQHAAHVPCAHGAGRVSVRRGHLERRRDDLAAGGANRLRQSRLHRAQHRHHRPRHRCLGARIHAAAATRGPGSVADLIAGVEALAAVAQQPVVVQRVDDGDAARRQHVHDLRRQARQVVHVRDVRPPLVDEPRGDAGDGRVAVRLLEAGGRAERVVDPRHAQAVARLDAHVVVRPRRVLLARQHEHVVAAALAQRARVMVGVDLAAALRVRRETVRDDQHAHQTARQRTGL